MAEIEVAADRTLVNMVEALVFAADEPVSAAEIARTYQVVTEAQGPDEEAIEDAVDLLNRAYQQNGHVLRIEQWAGGYRMATRDRAAAYLEEFFKQIRRVKLSRPLMETLAIVSYRQPVTRLEVDQVRGVNSDYALRRLLELDMILITGRSKSIGQPLLYGTTDHFLETFGLNDLNDLPNLRDIEALLDDPDFSVERARLLILNGLDASES
ncbi:MAG: SMC-Scp complex subunit ScpB [Bacteroidota bacterium]|nr:SMC-Scp complex subunit ScpB [Bacteroidota bacterium]